MSVWVIKRFDYSMLLRELGDPNPASGNTTQITLRLCHLLRQCETKLVFLLISNCAATARIE